MNKQETQQKLEEILARYRRHFKHYTDSNLPGGFVSFHLEKIEHESGDQWSDDLAVQYISSLESDMPVGS